MGNLIKAFLLITIITMSSDIVMADTFYSNNTNFHGTPSYTIYSFSDGTIVDKGDNISISLFISGAGDVDANKIRISIPPYIVKNDEVEIIHLAYNEQDHEILYPIFFYEESQISGNLLDVIFKEYDNLTNYGEKPIIYSPTGTFYAPITLNFKVDDNAPSGDHIIPLILFYKNESQWYVSEKDITLHIRYWYEKELFQYIVYFSIFIVFVQFLGKTYVFIRHRSKDS
jgi:hypothetical protein